MACGRKRIEKIRHEIAGPNGLTWEIDEFGGENRGLVLAEIEGITLDARIERPRWLGKEVTLDERFYNSSLIDHPYSGWGFQSGAAKKLPGQVRLDSGEVPP